MTIVDRAGLEATACEYYKVAHEPFNSLSQWRTTSATAAGGRDSIVARRCGAVNSSRARCRDDNSALSSASRIRIPVCSYCISIRREARTGAVFMTQSKS
jgi:hypothetical protein